MDRCTRYFFSFPTLSLILILCSMCLVRAELRACNLCGVLVLFFQPKRVIMKPLCVRLQDTMMTEEWRAIEVRCQQSVSEKVQMSPSVNDTTINTHWHVTIVPISQNASCIIARLACTVLFFLPRFIFLFVFFSLLLLRIDKETSLRKINVPRTH